jgi:hypothetical protein
MSNNLFLAIVGVILITIIGVIAVRKLEDCWAGNVKACPVLRGVSRGAPPPSQHLDLPHQD